MFRVRRTSNRDISERKVAEESLRATADRLNEAQSLVHLGSWTLDLTSGRLEWSDEIYRLFEIDPTQFGATYEAFLNAIHPDDRDAVNRAYTESLANRTPYEITHRLLMADGRIKWVHERCTSEFDAAGKPLRSSGTVQDVSKQKESEIQLDRYRLHLEELVEERTQQLAEAKEAAEAANRAKSIFLSNMSHELRTPLNAVLGFTQIMERDTNISDTHRRELATIGRSGRHLLSLINDVLEISRIEAGRTTVQNDPFDLEGTLTAVEEMIRVRAESKGLTLTVERQGPLPPYVLGDAHHLRQVLINLLGNAVKFTDRGQVRLRVVVEGEHILFEVADTGPGIAPEDRERIFQAFFQTEAGIAKGEGTGLGLTISREFVRLMGGELGVTSEPGKGSRFSFAIPLPPTVAPAGIDQQGTILGLAPGQAAPRILVAEDRPDNQQVITELLNQTGFQVRVAANGREALDLFQAWHPHLVLMDMRMPVMDGYEATRAIRALPEGGSIPIVALTASAFEEERSQILAMGCNEMVRKPIEQDHLFGIIGRLLDLRYVYGEKASTAAPPLQDLRALPADLRADLAKAAAILDKDAALAIVS
ncbi:MAG: PAS domain-containing hybrid sensor histidine kinase/response regulator, partial [Rhodocyclaceae bacterium]|nr:PAS domain-containing hybrid sensor histidine kinase/response regulator [Rhodocyclaceae bacterium]